MAKEKAPIEAIDKKAAAKKALAGLNKKFGAGTISTLSNWEGVLDIETIPTGCIGLDNALGRGGWPKGRISELVGFESSGKSTLCLHAVAECQKRDGIAAYVDVEMALDPVYAAKLGVNLDDMVLSQPDSAEQALQVVEDLIKSNAFDLVVVDSVAALVPQAELEGDFGKAQMGAQARLMSQAMRKLVGAVAESKCALLFVNQYRSKIGVMYGPSEVSTGGNALRFAASVRVEIRKGKAIGERDKVRGSITKVKVIKNKIAAPFKTAEFNILFGKGVDRQSELLTYSVNFGVIEKSGGWYSYGEHRIGHGLSSVVAYLLAHPDIKLEIEDKVNAMLTNGASQQVDSDEEESSEDENVDDAE